MSRSKGSNSKTEHSDTPGLVEGEPVLDSISEAREAEASVVEEVGDDVFLRKPSSISVVELGRKIPVVL